MAIGQLVYHFHGLVAPQLAAHDRRLAIPAVGRGFYFTSGEVIFGWHGRHQSHEGADGEKVRDLHG